LSLEASVSAEQNHKDLHTNITSE